MRRRTYVALIGSAFATALAGCAEDDPSSNDTDSTDGTDAETTDTATAEETTDEGTTEESATEESTETPTEFGPETFEGSGTSTSDPLDLSQGPITAEFSHDGESNFITELLTREGESYEDVSLTNLIGEVEGSTVAAVSADGNHNLNVDADGDWSITLEQPGSPSPESLPIDASDEGPSYVGPFEFDGPTEFSGSHDGESNFIVEPIPVDPSNLATSIFNEIGEFEGSTTERLGGLFYLNVDADGAWTLQTA